ncbi:MAG: CYTH domain-containing protein [Gammaproteobacteria bacterium]|nr:MAG: CYTH domain-containing protein [Gammaproteobacteria bacterium]
MSLEQEIKLVINGMAKLDLTSLSWLTDLAEGEIETKRLTNTYYDTPNLDLSKHELGLRMRHNGDIWFQTVKTSGSSDNGFHQRDEWEYELLDENWDLEKLKQTPLAVMINDSELWSQLQPVFTTDFIRETMQIILPEGTKIELAYDHGQVISGDLAEPIHELELELKSGSIDQLKQLAAQFCQRLSVSPSNINKAQRGYELASSTKVL